MNILRAFWALFLAGFVAYAFHRTWKWEHGAPMPESIFGGSKPRTKETVIWLDPSFLPVVLLVILIIFMSVQGETGVERFLSLSLDVMIVISIYCCSFSFFQFSADISAPAPAQRCGYCLYICSGKHIFCSRMHLFRLLLFISLRTASKCCFYFGASALLSYMQESLSPIFYFGTE